MRVNWFSNAPWAAQGYGVQTKLFVPRIQKLGHSMSITAYFGLAGGLAKFNDIPIYPNGYHPYGQDIIGAAAAHDRADILITLTDAWVVNPEAIPMPWFPWFPVDCDPIPPAVANAVRRSTRGIAMSRFGEAQARMVGLDPYYVPLGVDTKTYKRVEGSRERLKWPKDKFIVGMVAANKTTRKSFAEQIAAFAMLRMKHPDVMLYLHTADGKIGAETMDLPAFLQRMGLKMEWMSNDPVQPDTDVLFVDQYSYLLGLADSYMLDVYNSLDVLMSVSAGEGFGIPIVEAQACHCPVIVGNWTAMGELCGSGWAIDKREAEASWDNNFKAFRYVVHPEAVLERLEKAYSQKGSDAGYRERARKFALDYDADTITEKYWKPVLADIESHLHEVLPDPELTVLR